VVLGFNISVAEEFEISQERIRAKIRESIYENFLKNH
jgi:hypothetical protein